MKTKFKDYYNYAFTKTTAANDESSIKPECSTSEECGKSKAKPNVCCVNTILDDKVSGTKDILYSCMNVRETQASHNIDFFEVTMKCVDSNGKVLAGWVAAVFLSFYLLF